MSLKTELANKQIPKELESKVNEGCNRYNAQTDALQTNKDDE